MTFDELRSKLIEMRKERDQIIFEKGLAAEENKDIRENATYDYWFEKEQNITARILKITAEIEQLTKKPVVIKKIKQKPEAKVKDLPKRKWL